MRELLRIRSVGLGDPNLLWGAGALRPEHEPSAIRRQTRRPALHRSTQRPTAQDARRRSGRGHCRPNRRVNASRSRDSAMAGEYASAPATSMRSGERGPGNLYAPEIHLGRRRGVYDRAPVTSPREGFDTQRPLRRESPRGHRGRVGRIQFDDINIAESRSPPVLARPHDAYATRRPSGANAGSYSATTGLDAISGRASPPSTGMR